MVYIECNHCGKKVSKVERGMRNLKYCSRSCYQAERSKPYVAPKSKICTRCNKSKKIDDFYFVQEGEKGKKRWKHAAACKKCQHLYSYEWRKKYPERARDFVKKNQYKIRRIVLTLRRETS